MNFKEKVSGFLEMDNSPLTVKQDLSNPLKVIEILNNALADEALLCLKTRNAKWNLVGQSFFELSNIYEIHIKQLTDVTDEISKQTKILHGKQIGSFTEYLANTRLEEKPGIIPDVFQLLIDHENVICFIREDYRNCSKLYEDVSTADLLVSIIRQHEKLVWMLQSYIQDTTKNNEIPVNNQKL